MDQPRDETNESRLQAPDALRSALQNLNPPPFIPPTVDEAILKAARGQLRPAARARRRWFLARLCGAAVAFVLLVSVPILLFKRHEVARETETRYRQDLNHDGRVDILDALQVARRLDSGVTSQELDLNGDGVVNVQDAATIAIEAVRLDKGGRS